MAIVPQSLVYGTTSTSGTGPFTCTAAAGSRAFSVIANGAEVPYSRFDSSGAFEEGSATVDTVASVTTLTRVGSPHASSNSGAAVSWAPAATQNVVIGPTASTYLIKQNALSELAGVAPAVRATFGILSAALYTAEQLGFVTTGWSGGTNGKVVRWASSNTFADASQADTVDQLFGLAFKTAAGYFLPGSLITGLSGLTAGSVYYLGTSGNMTTTRPTESSSLRVVALGKAISTTSFLFAPAPPITK